MVFFGCIYQMANPARAERSVIINRVGGSRGFC